MNMYRVCSALVASAVIPCLWSPLALAQSAQPEQKPARVIACANPSTDTVHTFYLRNATQQNEANEIYTALRQILPPDAKTFFVPNQMAIELCASPEQTALAQKMLTDLDRPKKNYRLTYTVSEMDGATRVSSHHFSMVVTPGQQATLKQGSRVPIATESSSQSAIHQFTYVDVGMNFDATVETISDGIRLKTTVEQSSVAEAKGTGPENPVIRQASFKGTSYLVPGKPLKVGTFDIADSTRHLDLEVMMEPLP
jgi:hypothetical protein